MMKSVIDAVWNFGAVNLGSLITGLIGAFAGAWAAFKLERSKAMDDQNAANRDAMIRAQLILCCHVESLENIRRQFQAVKENMINGTCLLESGHVFNSDSISVSSLSFLVEHNEANLILRLHRADKAYKNTRDAILDRNLKVRDLRAVATIQEMDMETGGTTFTAPPGPVKLLKDTSKIMFDFLDNAIPEIVGCIEDNRKLAKRLFPGSNFPRLGAPIPDSKESNQPANQKDEQNVAANS